MIDPKPPSRLLSIMDVADQCAVSNRTVRRWLKAGELPAMKLGSQWRIDPDDLDHFLWKRRQK